MLSAKVEVRFNHAKRKIRGVKAASDRATDRAAEVMLAEAQRRVKRGKTLALAEGLRIRVLEAGGDEQTKTVAVGVWGVREGLFTEAGSTKSTTRHQRPAPFMRPAAALGRKVLKAEAESEVRRECMNG